MATNKNALIRYRTIDKCLQNRSRKWTLQDLIDECSDVLYEYEGKDTYVSKRTVQLDIQLMRSDKLGYNAPIVVYERRYYTYAEEDYSITDIPLTGLDLGILAESVAMLRQFKDFSLFQDVQGVIQKLEDKIHHGDRQRPPIIHIDKNENLQGLEHLDTLYQAILKTVVITITYQSFKARQPSDLDFHPYILKEFNNRWFVVGRKQEQKPILTLALDRIQRITPNLHLEYTVSDFNADTHYQHTYGVTVLGEDQRSDIEIIVDRANAPYVLTKPIHHSQRLIERLEGGYIRIGLNVHHNYELERLLLGFGPSMEIVKPRRLRQRMKKLLTKALENYQ